MLLLTRRDIVTDNSETPSSPALPHRPGIGSALVDVALLVPPGGGEPPVVAGAAARLHGAGFRTATVPVPPDSAPRPESTLRTAVADSRGVLVLVQQGFPASGVWLAWLLGHAAAAGPRIALLPIARRDPACSLWKRSRVLADLPYVGIARAVGDTDYSFWVLPAAAHRNSRDALNLDYWLHSR